MHPEDLADILRCPLCCGEEFDAPAATDPASRSGSLTCCSCGHVYPVENGVLDMLVHALLARLREPAEEWRKKQERHEQWWRQERTRPLAKATAPWRPSPSFLERYFRLSRVGCGSGRMLDLGCGEGHRAAHFTSKRYIGIDPLVLRNEYRFPFCRAVAEFLPFVDEAFDAALCVESLDHFLDPERALDEAIRVLCPRGALFIFLGLPQSGKEEPTGDRSVYSLREEDVHLHHLSARFFSDRLGGLFERLEVEWNGSYLGVWGWGKS